MTAPRENHEAKWLKKPLTFPVNGVDTTMTGAETRDLRDHLNHILYHAANGTDPNTRKGRVKGN